MPAIDAVTCLRLRDIAEVAAVLGRAHAQKKIWEGGKHQFSADQIDFNPPFPIRIDVAAEPDIMLALDEVKRVGRFECVLDNCLLIVLLRSDGEQTGDL